MSEHYGYNSGGGSFLGGIPPFTRNIIIINAIMFAATLINEDFMVTEFAMFFPTSQFFHWWQPITHIFMHGGFWHIFFNMYTLLIFGSVMERVLGSGRFCVFYFVTGLGAVLLHTGVQWLEAVSYVSSGASQSYSLLLQTPTLGASGAIYGVLIGYAMFFPDSVLTLIFPPVSMRAKWFVLIFIGIELLTGLTGTMGGVAHFAHLGGALFGFLLILFWRRTGRLYQRRW